MKQSCNKNAKYFHWIVCFLILNNRTEIPVEKAENCCEFDWLENPNTYLRDKWATSGCKLRLGLEMLHALSARKQTIERERIKSFGPMWYSWTVKKSKNLLAAGDKSSGFCACEQFTSATMEVVVHARIRRAAPRKVTARSVARNYAFPDAGKNYESTGPTSLRKTAWQRWFQVVAWLSRGINIVLALRVPGALAPG